MANIHDVLAKKGRYLFYRNGALFLKEKAKEIPVEFLRLTPEDLDKAKIMDDISYVLAFDIKEEEIAQSTGRKISNFLHELKERGIDFKVSNPLPPCLFENTVDDNIFINFHIPSSCKDCLELFIILDENTSETLICNKEKMSSFRFTCRGRGQIYDYLKLAYREKTLSVCKKCQKRCDFKIFSEDWTCRNRQDEHRLLKHRLNFSFYFITKHKYIWGGHKYFSIIKYFNFILWIIKNWHFLKDGYILDNGGGWGATSFKLVEVFKNKNVILLDINPLFLNIARERQKEINVSFPIINADARGLPFKDSLFKGAISRGVMHQLDKEGARRYLEEIFRVLCPGGVCVGHFFYHWDFGNIPFPVSSQDELIALLKKIGFMIKGKISSYTSKEETHKHCLYFECYKPVKL